MTTRDRQQPIQYVVWRGRVATGDQNASELFWLPPDTPFGNLQLKLHKLRQRAGHVNRRIDESWAEWRYYYSGEIGGGRSESLIVEEIMYSIRRSVDDLLSLRSLLDEEANLGDFPTRISIDCVGRSLKTSDPLVERHRSFLEFCNGSVNAYKHSFIQSDVSLIGANEPCVFAFALPQNNLVRGWTLLSESLNEVVIGFNEFLDNALEEIAGHGQRLMASNT